MKRLTVASLCVLGLTACGVSKQKYAALEDQTKSCEASLESAKSEQSACEARLEQLGTRREELKQELETKTKTYEQLVGSLKKEISAGKIKISEMEGRLTVNLIDKILFDSGSTVIAEEGKEALAKIAEVLKGVEGREIQVEGHTDNVKVGPRLVRKFPTNWELSTERATVVVRYLADLGVPETKLSATGFSMFQPVADNDTPEGRQQNRRIEITLAPELDIRPTGAGQPAGPPATEP